MNLQLRIKSCYYCTCTTVNHKESVYIKYGFKTKESEIAKSGGMKIEMFKIGSPLGNYFNCVFYI